MVLAEIDSAYVGQPWDLTQTPDGGYVISDGFARRLLVFGRDGRFERAIGREGDGPGEFRAPTWLAFAGDSVLYAADGTDVQQYNWASGAFQQAYSVPRVTMMLGTRNGTLYVGNVSPDSQASLAAFDPGSRGMRMIGPLPALLRDNEPIQQMWDGVVPAVSEDRIASVYSVNDTIYVMRPDGTPLNRVSVPAVRRRGVQTGMLNRFAKDPSDMEAAEKALFGSSRAMDMQWLSSGKLALVSVDGNVVNGRNTGSYFLSVVDPETGRSCVDAPVPGPTDPVPVVDFRGDTLLVLTQQVSADNRGVTTVHRYRIDTTSCDWLRP